MPDPFRSTFGPARSPFSVVPVQNDVIPRRRRDGKNDAIIAESSIPSLPLKYPFQMIDIALWCWLNIERERQLKFAHQHQLAVVHVEQAESVRTALPRGLYGEQKRG